MSKKSKNISKASVVDTSRSTNKKSTKPSEYWDILWILLATIATFLMTSDNGFVNWDDDKNFYENKIITTLTGDNFWQKTIELFQISNNVIGNYNPLSNWTFLVENKFFGLNEPGNSHIINLLLHLLCVYLVYRIVQRMSLSRMVVIIATLLFAVHPMRVESVVWITERKDVLFGAFYLAAILNYLKYKVDKSKLRLISIYILFLLSLLSKVQAVMLPLSLICFDYYYDKRIEIKQFLTKFPMFLFSLFFGLLAIYLLKEYGSIDSNDQFTGISRIFIGSYSLLVYLVKSILPFRLSPLYPYPSELNWVFYASIFIFPLYIFALYKSYRNKDTVYFFGLSFFLVNIIMLLQILGAGQGFIADRFTYIAYLGLFIIYAQLIQTLLDKYPKKKLVISIGMAGIMAIYAMMSFNQTKIWKDSGTLWSHVLKYYQNITLPYGNRANFYRDEGMKKEALADYNNAISLKPSAATYNSRARLYFDSGNNRDTIILALNDYNKAIEIEEDKSKIGEYYVNRGATWARLGDLDKSIEDLNMGLKLKPDQLSGYINRSIMYRSKGDYKNSLEDIKTYLKFNPNSADIWYEKGILERYFKNTQEALNNFNQAIRIDDNKAIYYYGRSQAWYDLQNIDNARKDFNMSLAKGFDKYDSNYRNLLGI